MSESSNTFRTCPECGRLLLGSWSHECVKEDDK